ncbi:GTP-binding protein obg [Anaerohalosphaera lusitana]|uniref:GTP-binding protein obg n=1 Tax=Anaerohalosphaera lusitana TaxID=1936003 RepID=A0A1U9NIF9_9BACT|nr:GTPase [Anaerohalosphaera lusitana]AQT67296.1 GTP-binding protein obg [Anaerohalosphaera lusitana]
MPANLTPDYFKAEKWFKSASTDEERILALEEMLRVIPKHKGTDHMRADLRKKLSKLRTAVEEGGKKGGKRTDIFHVPKNGAGQLVLVGTPNCGKSSVVAAVSKASVNVTDFPFATQTPVPGMMYHEDVQIEIVDMPPITPDYAPAGMVNTYRNCDIIGIVIDVAADPLEQMEVCTEYLQSHRLLPDENTDEQDEQGNRLARKTIVICTKIDAAPDGTIETLAELTERDFEYLPFSAHTGEGLHEMVARVFELLNVVRVYAKKPGKEPDMKEPFTLDKGSTVEDLAFTIHRELAEKLQSARAWNAPDIHDGQNVQKTHELTDKEIIELHFA